MKRIALPLVLAAMLSSMMSGSRLSRMPESGERSQPSSVARYLGAGQYEIEGLRFSKPDWWNVGLAVHYSGGTDSLAFNLIIPK